MKTIIIPEVLYTGGKMQAGQAVCMEAGRITAVAPTAQLLQANPDAALLHWDHLAMLPGTVNVHNHCFQSLLRGLAVDRPFLEWRDQALYRYSPLLTPEDLYTGAVFAFSEMLKCGVTTVCDFFYVHNHGVHSDEAIIQAARDVGIRLVLARTMYDWQGAPAGYVERIDDAVRNTECLARKYNGKEEQMTTVLPAPHSLHAASVEMIKAGKALADQLGTRFHIHVAEEPFEVEGVQKATGKRPVELLESLGVLDSRMVAVHAVWLSEQEMRLFCDRGANLAYCPSSNMFLADGVTNIDYLCKHGVRVGLGTDGACSNNRISVFEEMRMASLLQKATRLDALSIPTAQAFDFGTKNGGEILELPVGEIKPGQYADLVGVDVNDLSLQPLFADYTQLLANIVYAMQPTAIARVMVNGRERAGAHGLLGVPQAQVRKGVQALMRKFQML